MLCLSLTAFAETELQTPSDDDISVCYLYTDKISGTLSISNKAATCKSTVRGISGTTTKIVITQTLQKKNGSSRRLRPVPPVHVPFLLLREWSRS